MIILYIVSRTLRREGVKGQKYKLGLLDREFFTDSCVFLENTIIPSTFRDIAKNALRKWAKMAILKGQNRPKIGLNRAKIQF